MAVEMRQDGVTETDVVPKWSPDLAVHWVTRGGSVKELEKLTGVKPAWGKYRRQRPALHNGMVRDDDRPSFLRTRC